MSTSRQDAVELLRILGAGGDSANKSMVDSISRAVMRNPSADSTILSIDIKDSLNTFFADKTDAQIDWILSNASESRGHLKDAQAVRDFCSGKTQVSSSAQFGAIDGLLSAINYARFGNVTDGNVELEGIKQQVGRLQTDGIQVPYIGATHKERSGDMSVGSDRSKYRAERGLTEGALQRKDELEGQNILAAPNRAITLASGFEPQKGMDASPIDLPKRQLFQNQGYAKLASDTGVPLMGHISGTTPGNLKVADSLLKANGKPGLTTERATTLAGATAASFHRSGFHAAPEVLVGLRHFLGTHATVDNVANSPEEMKQLFSDSVMLMAGAGATQIAQAVDVVVSEIREHPNLTNEGLVPTIAEKSVEVSDIETYLSESTEVISEGSDLESPISEISDDVDLDDEAISLMSEIDDLSPQEDGAFIDSSNAQVAEENIRNFKGFKSCMQHNVSNEDQHDKDEDMDEKNSSSATIAKK